MICREVRDNLSAFLDGELDGELAARVETHLASCEACRAELESLREVVSTLHALPRHPAPPEIEREILALVERDALLGRTAAPAPRRRFAFLFRGSAVAAAAVLAVVGVYFSLYRDRRPATEMLTAPRDSDGYVPRAPGGPAAGLSRGETEGGDRLAGRDKRDYFYARNDDSTSGYVATKPDGDLKRTLKNEKEGGEAPAAPDWMSTEKKAGEAVARGPADVGVKALAPAVVPATPAPGVAPATPAAAPATELLETVAESAPPRPEVLELELVAADLNAARASITALAGSLHIRTVQAERFSAEGVEHDLLKERMDLPTKAKESVRENKPVDAEGRLRAEAEDGRVRDALTKVAQVSHTDGEFEATVSRLLAIIDSNGEGALAPFVVLAVPEDKLPELVARLTAESSAEASRVGKLAAVTSPPPQHGQNKDVRAQAEKRKADPLDEFMKALDEAAKEDAERERMAQDTAGREGEPGRIGRTHLGDTRRPSPSTPAKDVAKTTENLEDAKKDNAKGKAPRMVYLQIYLTRAAKAADAAKPATPPAK